MREQTIKKPVKTKDLLNDYKEDKSMWNDESDKVRLTKEALWKLSETDRLLIVLYCEIGSLRKLGEMLGVSRTTAYGAIKSIKSKMKKYVDERLSAGSGDSDSD